MSKYCIELIWNREFHWIEYEQHNDKEMAIAIAKSIRDSGDGARVKNIRVIDNTTDKIVWRG